MRALLRPHEGGIDSTQTVILGEVEELADLVGTLGSQAAGLGDV